VQRNDIDLSFSLTDSSLYLAAALTCIKKGMLQGIEVEGFENKN
jgi:hypothetical protein